MRLAGYRTAEIAAHLGLSSVALRIRLDPPPPAPSRLRRPRRRAVNTSRTLQEEIRVEEPVPYGGNRTGSSFGRREARISSRWPHHRGHGATVGSSDNLAQKLPKHLVESR